ncbi:MAG TPA: acyl-CoA dehydrogenase family protein, partial [Mycobacteriales bacterium]|nr:acyl-CoA dehydrogenase family protein [Mycobacteriales bacterium]
MDFRMPDELTALRASFATFLDREVRPLEESLREESRREESRREGAPLEADPVRIRDAADTVRRRAATEGFYAAHLPVEAGGQGLSTLGMVVLVEDAARSGLRLAPFAVAPPNPEGPTPLLLELPRHLWDRYLLPVVRAEQTMCFALTEPEAGSDAQAIRTRAYRDGTEWVIEGHKHYITNAARADFALVFAVTDPEKRAAGGITAFVVPRDQFRVGPTQYTMADTHPAELFFDAARVPEDHVVGEVGTGFVTAMRFLNAGRAFIGAQCLGMAGYCLDAAVAHARTRTAFGRPLG